MKKYISFDIGGTKVKHCLLLEDATILSKSSYTTHTSNLEMLLKDMVETIEKYMENHHVSGVAVSMPGFINPHTGYSETGGSVYALSNQNLKALLEARIPLQVEIENDGNCATLAEKISGNAINCSDFVCVILGTGVGGGIFIDGKILHGHSFRGGEFGFMVTKSGNKFKDWHSDASTSALIHSYKKLKGISEYEKISGKKVFLESEKNQSVRKLIEGWTKKVSYRLFNLAATLNPQKILIGGGVSAQSDLISMINEQLDKIPLWKDFKVPVERCKYENDAGMIGAMYHLKQKQSR
ncbi:ROK family protein [Bacillus salipaludis]|uniref:ROK family protein n=1 Tax=Bacillus salipaludis TaxID=2547811 RepID=UPI003D1ABB74